MKHIQTITVGAGGAANIEFTSIPQTYTDLLIVISGRGTGSNASGGATVSIRPNGLTTNQTSRRLGGSGSGTVSDTDTIIYTRINSVDETASTFGNSSVYITNYTSSNNKSFSLDGVFENNATFARQELQAGLWSSSSAITSVTLVPGTGNFVQYSSASLYGIKNS